MKKKKSGKKNRTNAIIGLVVIMVIIPLGIYFYNQQKASQENSRAGWITSGPFTIVKDKYRLGDTVFMIVQGLKPNDAGKIVILDPKGGIYAQVPFNGTMKSEFNYMLKPNTVRAEKLCTPQDLVGNWTITFQGARYQSIPFQVTNEWVEGAQSEIKPIPNPC